MTSVRALARRLPAIHTGVRLARFLVDEVWFTSWVRLAPRRFMERAQRDRTWNFETAEGQAWHAHVLSVLRETVPDGSLGDVVEIGCSEGLFTRRLALHATHVLACDLSPLAVQRTSTTCATFPHVEVHTFDLARHTLPRQFDIVVAMDVLSCIRGRDNFAGALSRLVQAVRPGGIFVYSDNSMPVDVLRQWGSDRWWHRALGVLRPEACVDLLVRQHRMTVVHAAPYATATWDRDQYLAVLRRECGPATMASP